MSLQFENTSKEYYLVVNHPELLKRAEELGYEGVTLIQDDGELGEEDIAAAIKADKTIVRILYRTDHEEGEGVWSHRHIEDTDLYIVTIDLYGNQMTGGKPVKSIDDAIEDFPPVDQLEIRMRGSAIIKETDYTNRCGNCHSYLGENDKYCRYCGAERGKGRFEPFKNETYCVYGPPVKKKYKCTACGHVWITGQLGGDNSKYCPQCGKKTVNVIEDKALWDFFTSAIGYEEPYEEDERPVLFTEEQVKSLLDQREAVQEASKEGSNYISREMILDALRKAGVDIPENADYDNYPRTEKEGEQINLAHTILQLEGTNIEGIRNVYCHHCGSSYIAALGYTVSGKKYEEIAKGVHAESEEDALVFNGYGRILYDNPERRTENYLAYICLKCGKEFGRLEIPDSVVKAYKRQVKRLEREEMAKNAGYLAVGIGVTVADKVKPVVKKIGNSAKGLPAHMRKKKEDSENKNGSKE